LKLHKAFAGVCALLLMAAAGAAEMSDAQVREKIVRESIAAYHGACPCPEFSDSRGNACGERSAWSRAGGNRPICYAHEVTDEQVRKYRARLRSG
jgi:hypothetical protein